WLTKLGDELDVKRPALLAFINAGEIWKLAEPFLAQAAEQGPPDAARVLKVIDALGVKQLRHVAWASGLDETSGVSKFLIAHQAEAGGLVSLLRSKPLTAADLKHLPKSAEFAAAGSFNAKEVFQQVL